MSIIQENLVEGQQKGESFKQHTLKLIETYIDLIYKILAVLTNK